MSLLNDALRKKKKDEQKIALDTTVFGRESRPAKSKSIKLVVLALLILALGSLFLLDTFISRPQPVVSSPRPVPTQSLTPPPTTVTSLSTPVTTQSTTAQKIAAVPIQPPPERKTPQTRRGIPAGAPPVTTPVQAEPTAADTQDKAAPIVAAPLSAAPAPDAAAGLDTTLPAPVKPFFDKATALQRDGHCNEAINFYRNVLQQVPRHRDSLFNLTECLIEQERYEEAHSGAVLLSRELPGEPRAWLDLAVTEIGLAKYEIALDHLDRVVSLNGYPFETHLNRGVAHGRLGRFDKALDAYRSAERLQPSDPTLLFNLALAHDKAGQLPEAGRYYERYLKHTDLNHPKRRSQVEARLDALRRYQMQLGAAAQ